MYRRCIGGVSEMYRRCIGPTRCQHRVNARPSRYVPARYTLVDPNLARPCCLRSGHAAYASCPPSIHQSTNPSIHRLHASLATAALASGEKGQNTRTPTELLQNSYGTPSEVHRSQALSTSEQRAGNALVPPTSDPTPTLRSVSRLLQRPLDPPPRPFTRWRIATTSAPASATDPPADSPSLPQQVSGTLRGNLVNAFHIPAPRQESLWP